MSSRTKIPGATEQCDSCLELTHKGSPIKFKKGSKTWLEMVAKFKDFRLFVQLFDGPTAIAEHVASLRYAMSAGMVIDTSRFFLLPLVLPNENEILAVLTLAPRKPGVLRESLENLELINPDTKYPDREEERYAAMKWVLVFDYYLPADVDEQHRANIIAALDEQWC